MSMLKYLLTELRRQNQHITFNRDELQTMLMLSFFLCHKLDHLSMKEKFLFIIGKTPKLVCALAHTYVLSSPLNEVVYNFNDQYLHVKISAGHFLSTNFSIWISAQMIKVQRRAETLNSSKVTEKKTIPGKACKSCFVLKLLLKQLLIKIQTLITSK